MRTAIHLLLTYLLTYLPALAQRCSGKNSPPQLPSELYRAVHSLSRSSGLVTVRWPLSASLASTPKGMPGTPPIFWLGGRQREYPPTFGYSRPILVALRSLSLKPIPFGYKTPPIRFSQAGGQSVHKARPPNLELALTPLLCIPKTCSHVEDAAALLAMSGEIVRN